MTPDDMKAWVERVKAARARLEACPGATLREEMLTLSRTYRIFTTNGQHLQEHLATAHGPGAIPTMFAVDRRARLDAFLYETDRLLHNYVAAAGSLRDHTRRLWDKHPPSDDALNAEYERRVGEAFTTSPLVQFIQGLRNDMLHRRLPGSLSVTISLSDDDGSETVTVGFPADQLLQAGEWKAQARTYLEERAGEVVDISQIVDDYTNVVRGFNDWFGNAWVDGHRAAFDEYDRLVKEHDALIPDEPEWPPQPPEFPPFD